MNDQNNQQVNSQRNTATGGSVGGYASPYSGNTTQQPHDTNQNKNQGTQPEVQEQKTPDIQSYLNGNMSSQNDNSESDKEEKNNSDSVTPVTPVAAQPSSQPSATAAPQVNSDNLLDHPEKVDEILKKGDTTVSPVSQQPVQLQSQANQNTQALAQQSPFQPAAPTQYSDKPAVQSSQQPNSTPPAITANQQQEMYQQSKPTPSKSEQVPTVNTVKTQNNQSGKPVLTPDEDLKVLTPRNIDGTKINTSKYDSIAQLLDLVIEKNGSDLHLTVNYPPYIRVDDRLIPVGDILTKEDVKKLISQTLTGNQTELLEVNREVDLSYQHKDQGRFRINAYYERGNLAAAYRLIPQRIRTITELNLPGILLDITQYSQGLFLVTGPTGSGKSTSLAAMIQHINETSPKHVITIEDPIEYVYPRAMSLIDQRELGGDTHDWSIALKSALRQDPDVLLIGEMRDFETIQSAITLAETGHLVFATLHTNSAAQSIDRIIDVFPPHQQEQIKTQLAGSLKGILSQRLVPLIGGGRQAVIELLLVTPAVQNLIREGKTYQLDNVIATGADLGMISMEKSLVKLVREGKITTATAQDYAIRPEEVLKLMKGGA